jgi:hypothetical protein
MDCWNIMGSINFILHQFPLCHSIAVFMLALPILTSSCTHSSNFSKKLRSHVSCRYAGHVQIRPWEWHVSSVSGRSRMKNATWRLGLSSCCGCCGWTGECAEIVRVHWHNWRTFSSDIFISDWFSGATCCETVTVCRYSTEIYREINGYCGDRRCSHPLTEPESLIQQTLVLRD